jgi:uncharacterized damage-inducible protein DinB
MIETLRRMYRYQDWAMEQFWPALDTLTAEELDAPGCSGNGSVRGTLTHLIRVQNGWFLWFDGTLSAADAQSMRRKDPDYTHRRRAFWMARSQRSCRSLRCKALRYRSGKGLDSRAAGRDDAIAAARRDDAARGQSWNPYARR